MNVYENKKQQKSEGKESHLTSGQLDKARQQADAKADRVIGQVMRSGLREQMYSAFAAKTFDEMKGATEQAPILTEYFFKGNELPDWADDGKMSKAAKLFRSNGNEFLFMLGIVSLPYCYAAAKGALSLYHTEKIRKNTEARLLDTTSFIVDIMQEDAFTDNGRGYLVVKQVRLRHALARYYLQKIPLIMDLNEKPINQEDMAGTNLAFSYVALREMPKIGVNISLELQDAYIHFWSVIGYLLGLQKAFLPANIREAFWLEKRISNRHFSPSKEGQELTKQLINHYKKNIPNRATTALINPLIRYLLGMELSQIIGLRQSGGIYPADYLMTLLPLFKKFIFPPVQSFDQIVNQIEQRKVAN